VFYLFGREPYCQFEAAPVDSLVKADTLFPLYSQRFWVVASWLREFADLVIVQNRSR
jgi:phenylalanine-4-hydroxylase